MRQMVKPFGWPCVTRLRTHISLLSKKGGATIWVLVVITIVTGSILATSVSKVSQLTIAVVNSSDQEVVVRIWVDDFDDRHTTLGPQEGILYCWDITGWPLHRYDILIHDADILVSYAVSWSYILVTPFTEKTMVFEVGNPH